MKCDDIPQHVIPGTEHIYAQYLASNDLERHEPELDDTFSTEAQRVMKRKIRTMIVKHWKYIYSQLVYPETENHKEIVSNILNEHKIQICFYENGEVKVKHNLKSPSRDGLIFRVTDDQVFQPKYFHEDSTLGYFEAKLADWYGKDLEVESLWSDITLNSYFEKGLVDITKDDIKKDNVKELTFYQKLRTKLSELW